METCGDGIGKRWKMTEIIDFKTKQQKVLEEVQKLDGKVEELILQGLEEFAETLENKPILGVILVAVYYDNKKDGLNHDMHICGRLSTTYFLGVVARLHDFFIKRISDD